MMSNIYYMVIIIKETFVCYIKKNIVFVLFINVFFYNFDICQTAKSELCINIKNFVYFLSWIILKICSLVYKIFFKKRTKNLHFF